MTSAMPSTAHDVQIDRIESGHHENAREKLVDAEPRVQHAGYTARDHPGEKRHDRRQERIRATDDERRRDRRPERKAAVRGDIRKAKHAGCDVHTPRECRERESEHERGEPEVPCRSVTPISLGCGNFSSALYFSSHAFTPRSASCTSV